MVGWHHQLNGRESEHTPGDGEGQGSLACCSPWGCKESDTAERLNNKSREVGGWGLSATRRWDLYNQKPEAELSWWKIKGSHEHLCYCPALAVAMVWWIYAVPQQWIHSNNYTTEGMVYSRNTDIWNHLYPCQEKEATDLHNCIQMITVGIIFTSLSYYTKSHFWFKQQQAVKKHAGHSWVI